MSFVEKTPKKQLIAQIAKTWLTIKQIAKNMLSELKYDLTFEQIMVLHILFEVEGQNLGAIADKADRERTTISRMIDGLEKRNLVVRVPDKTDKRQKLLYLTALGKERVFELKELSSKLDEALYKDIEEKEVENCLLTMTKMFNNICQKQKI